MIFVVDPVIMASIESSSKARPAPKSDGTDASPVEMVLVLMMLVLGDWGERSIVLSIIVLTTVAVLATGGLEKNSLLSSAEDALESVNENVESLQISEFGESSLPWSVHARKS